MRFLRSKIEELNCDPMTNGIFRKIQKQKQNKKIVNRTEMWDTCDLMKNKMKQNKNEMQKQ